MKLELGAPMKFGDGAWSVLWFRLNVSIRGSLSDELWGYTHICLYQGWSNVLSEGNPWSSLKENLRGIL